MSQDIADGMLLAAPFIQPVEAGADDDAADGSAADGEGPRTPPVPGPAGRCSA
ncbi:hypothetical protein [Streptomyces endophytica]|uniref:Uncharacterized protein n=1 Tax=Streptomyces endophytica TaxID=2991496 RepID=A0ABY6P679_9ACTN|nr:hypothetical protein [Streptomyces endophytica]UZJ29295.1 hypothetical protein OJ254_00775 [Streptomyces endophytica]